MTLTPQDVEDQVFKERFRGYDQDEVDEFLDVVAASIGELTRERDQLLERIRELERRTGHSGESEQLLQRTLVAAQRTADETIDEARATATQTIEDARAQAAEIIADANRRVGDEGRQAMEAVRHVRQAVAELSRFRSEYRERFEAVIAEQLALLDRTADLPELPEGLRSLGEPGTPRSSSAGSDVGATER